MSAALFIWGAGALSINFLASDHSLPGQTAMISKSNLAFQAASPTSTTAKVAPVKHAKTLPSGPSGQLLPPGTMASDKTYSNGYTRGQCTWYVAGRRQIPGNWGNAVTWYYHARSSGWAVGATPAVGAIAWTPTGRYGHVALVEKVSADGKQVVISEMNFRGPYIKGTRTVSASSFKYIY